MPGSGRRIHPASIDVLADAGVRPPATRVRPGGRNGDLHPTAGRRRLRRDRGRADRGHARRVRPIGARGADRRRHGRGDPARRQPPSTPSPSRRASTGSTRRRRWPRSTACSDPTACCCWCGTCVTSRSTGCASSPTSCTRGSGGRPYHDHREFDWRDVVADAGGFGPLEEVRFPNPVPSSPAGRRGSRPVDELRRRDGARAQQVLLDEVARPDRDPSRHGRAATRSTTRTTRPSTGAGATERRAARGAAVGPRSSR